MINGGADPEYGLPSAMDCIVMFKQEETWKVKFESAKGRGKADITSGTRMPSNEKISGGDAQA